MIKALAAFCTVVARSLVRLYVPLTLSVCLPMLPASTAYAFCDAQAASSSTSVLNALGQSPHAPLSPPVRAAETHSIATRALAQGSAPPDVSPDSVRQSQTPPPPVEPAAPAPQVKPLTHVAPFPEIHWTALASGLELGFSQLPESREKEDTAVFVILRIDPAQHQFALGMASEVGQSRSLAEWSRQLNLNAGINASMYLPDNVTSTGYMRNGKIWNNEKIGSKLGAFFVAKRKNRAEKQADIIERDTPSWGERLENYAIVVQNYRLIDSRGKTLWPPGGPMHSIAVVARDTTGRIDFILCQEPLTAERFAHYLKSLPLSISTTMYVEGGAQAGMFLQVEKDTATDIPAFFAGASSHATPEGTVHIWKGRHSLLNTAGNPDAPVPNILGIQKRVGLGKR